MADEPKKPRKIKDLKARLGRTIAPNTPGADGKPAAPITPPSGGIVPPGGVNPPTGGVKPPTGGVVPPSGVMAPKAAVPAGSPFAPKQPSAPPPSNDPFAAAPAAVAAGPQEVRLVLDDSAVDDAEVGKKQRSRNLIIILAGLVVGLGLGFAVGSVMDGRKTVNNAIRDAGAIKDAIGEASTVVLEAQRLVDRAARAALSNPPTVDYEAIDALRALEQPFQADVFSSRNYFLFEPATVNSLFNYYQNTGRAWNSIGSIVNLTSGDERRERLNAAATADRDTHSDIGCVPAIVENRVKCSLGFVEVTEENGEPSVQVRASRRSRRTQSKEIYTGGDLGDSPDNYVILVNSQNSQGVLGEQASLFREYVREIVALKQLLTTTVEQQGEVENGVAPIAERPELFAF